MKNAMTRSCDNLVHQIVNVNTTFKHRLVKKDFINEENVEESAWAGYSSPAIYCGEGYSLMVITEANISCQFPESTLFDENLTRKSALYKVEGFGLVSIAEENSNLF